MATRKMPLAAAKKSRSAAREKATPSTPALTTTAAKALWKTLGSATATTKSRIAALAALGWAIANDRASYRVVLGLLADTGTAAALRVAALAAVQSVSFDAQRFSALRPDYLRALRGLSEDADLELRQRALGMLMREGDAPTQQRLLAGLRDPGQALLSPEKTLQLLAYEVHGEAYEAARQIVQQPPNPLARREALRLLAADPASVPLFEKLVLDKQESSELRRLSASALHQLAPDRLQALARDITLDSDDDHELRAACLVAMTQFGNAAAVAGDTALRDQVDRLGASEPGAPADSALGQAAQQFVDRYGSR